MRKVVTYSFGAIALYLVVFYSAGAGNVILEGSKGAARVVQAFQGRTVTGL